MPEPKKLRADAQRNVDALLTAAKDVFAADGVDAPVKQIATRAGVGVGTVYRHFPQRADLVKAVFQQAVDATAAAADDLRAAHPPMDALRHWLTRYTEFVRTKRGLAAALHSGDPTFDSLPAYFLDNLGPTLQRLLDEAAAAHEIRTDVDAKQLLHAVAMLCVPVPHSDADDSQHMVGVLIDGLRQGATGSREG